MNYDKMTRERRMAQFRPARLVDHLTLIALILIGAGIALVVADAILGPENVTYWLADLIA